MELVGLKALREANNPNKTQLEIKTSINIIAATLLAGYNMWKQVMKL